MDQADLAVILPKYNQGLPLRFRFAVVESQRK